MARRKRQLPKAVIARLGTVPDRVIAAERGVSIRCVGQWRESLGIPAYLPERTWTKREIRLLGTMLDANLAIKLRRTPDSIKSKRRSLGIPGIGPKVLDIDKLKNAANDTISDD